MQKRVIAILMILLLAFGAFACNGTEQPVQPTQEAEVTPPEVHETPVPTEAPAVDDEYFLPKEDGTKQLTIYWKADKINF